MNKSIDPNVYRGTDRHIYITVYMFRQEKWAKDTQKIVKQPTGKMDRRTNERTNEYSGNLTIRHPAKSVICKKRGKKVVEWSSRGHIEWRIGGVVWERFCKICSLKWTLSLISPQRPLTQKDVRNKWMDGCIIMYRGDTSAFSSTTWDDLRVIKEGITKIYRNLF